MSSNSKRKSGDQLDIKFPKPRYADERRKKKLAKAFEKKEFQDRIKGLDGGLCQNIRCGNSWYWRMQVQGHHICYLSDGGSNEDHNGITLCALCHREAHRSRAWVLALLLELKQEFEAGRRKEFRWQPAIEELKQKGVEE